MTNVIRRGEGEAFKINDLILYIDDYKKKGRCIVIEDDAMVIFIPMQYAKQVGNAIIQMTDNDAKVSKK